MAPPLAKYSGGKIPLHSDLRARGARGGPPSKSEIAYANVCGLNSNLNPVHHYLQSQKPDILFLTETQISAKTSTNHLLCPGYELLTSFRLHGGVCAYVRNNLSCTRLPDLESGKRDIMWLKLINKSSTKFFCCIYRSPSDSSYNELFDFLSAKIDFIISQFPTAEVTILGDFNVHNTEWLGSTKTDPQGRAAENFAISNSLTNLVSQPTYFPRIATHNPNPLDLFLTTHPEPYQISISAPLGKSDHGLVCVTSAAQFEASEILPPRTIWHYRAADWDGLRDFFSIFPWTSVCFPSSDPSIICQEITEIIKLGIETYIPHTTQKPPPSTNKPWFSQACEQARIKKIQAHKKFLQNPTPENKQTSIQARNLYNNTISRSKDKFNSCINNKVAACSNGSKSFWTLAKTIGQNFCKSSFPPLTFENEIISTSKGKAELFAKHFAANSTLSPPLNHPLPTVASVQSKMSEVTFKVRQVKRILSTLNIKKSCGLDGIPAVVLKNCAPELAPVLTRLFRLSYEKGIFPDGWKAARVQPIPKKGSKTLPNNYRPISLLSTLSKVMEKLLNSQILNYLEKHKLINDRQYGFRHKRSTADLLTFVTHSWNKSLEYHGESQVIALDISKAFDQVWHEALLNKLPSYGLPPKLCLWISSFLSNRRISVVVDGHSSGFYPINSGVPQGSVLAPTLFLLHINDLLSSTTNSIHSFADDSTLHSGFSFPRPVSQTQLDQNRREMQLSLTQDLQSILDWGSKNLVHFNASKTQSCCLSRKKSNNANFVSMNGQILQNSESFGLVGINFTDDLEWRRHITSIAAAAAKKLGFLYRAKRYFSSDNLYTLYVSQIRPGLEYCSHIWGAASPTTLGILDSIQRRAFRLIDDPVAANRLPSLSHRRTVGDLSLFYRYFNGFCSEELSTIVPPLVTHNRATRGALHSHPFTVQLQKPRTSHFVRSFVPRVSRLWNQLPATVFPSSPNLQKFKSHVNKYLLSHPIPPFDTRGT